MSVQSYDVFSKLVSVAYGNHANKTRKKTAINQPFTKNSRLHPMEYYKRGYGKKEILRGKAKLTCTDTAQDFFADYCHNIWPNELLFLSLWLKINIVGYDRTLYEQILKMKRAIVIGASSGIGMEVARLLLQQGWTLGVAARRVELLQSLGAAEVEQIDVTAEDATSRLRSLIDRIGGMDLFYASGIGKQNRELHEDIELATLNTNGLGFTRMIGEAYRYFAERNGGHIAAITSIAGTKGLGPAPSYSATKAMQNVYLQALEQLANARGLNIRFTDIRPGFVDTALLNGNFHYPMMLQPQKVAQEIVAAVNRRQHIRIIDWRYRLLTALWRRIPRLLWRRFRL